MRRYKGMIILVLVLLLMFAVSPALAAEEEAGPLASLGINLGFLFAQLINFGLIFGVLTAVLWRPATNMLDARAAKIEKGLQDASAAADARRNAEAEAEKILAEARTQAQQVIEEARGRGDEVAKTIEAEAREEGEKIRQDARISAQSERNAELANLRDQVVSISVAVAERLIGENLDQDRQKALVDNFFTNLPEEAKGMTGEVEVISAMPLSDDEQGRISGELNASNVTFVVDPNILGGLVVRSGDRVVDGSVRRGLNDISSRLN